MGATLTAVFIHGSTAYIAEVGDSRAYLVRNGHIEQVTRDQSYVQLMIDSGTMSPEEAKNSQLSNVILQAMGLSESVQVALGRLDLRQRDCFVLCSDGLSGLVSADEIRDVVLTAGRPDVVCAGSSSSRWSAAATTTSPSSWPESAAICRHSSPARASRTRCRWSRSSCPGAPPRA